MKTLGWTRWALLLQSICGDGGPRKRLTTERGYLLKEAHTVAKGQGVPQTLKITKSRESALVWVCPKIHSCDGNIIPQSHTDGIWRWGLGVTGSGGFCPNEYTGPLTGSWTPGFLREWLCHKGKSF